MNYTKGKWRLSQVGPIIIGVNAVIEESGVGVYSQNVCEFILPDTDAEYEAERVEREANARLISAAPELLEALIAARHEIETGKGMTPRTHLIPMIDSAIKKATS